MRLCQIVPSLEERYGGPSRSVRALSAALAGAGHEVSLLATHPEEPVTRTDGRLAVRIFRRGSPGSLCPSAGLRAELQRTGCDVIHHHSLWLRTLHYAHRRARAARVPLVISPRGMMAPWAWGHRAWRKKFARLFVHPGALAAAAGWHATSEAEAADIRSRGFAQPVCVAPNAVAALAPAEAAAALAHWRETCPESATRPTALFHSRFHRKKRVLELIDLWLQTAPPDWLLLVVGLEDEYSPAQVADYVYQASGSGRVRVFDGDGRPPPYPAASILLLPSHNENFGLVIAEAMAQGLPVLVTDTTPWRPVNDRDLGWCVAWPDYAAALGVALAEGPARLAARGRRARDWVLAEFSWARSAGLLADFYARLGGAGTGR